MHEDQRDVVSTHIRTAIEQRAFEPSRRCSWSPVHRLFEQREQFIVVERSRPGLIGDTVGVQHEPVTGFEHDFVFIEVWIVDDAEQRTVDPDEARTPIRQDDRQRMSADRDGQWVSIGFA